MPRIILITGANGALGLATAEAFAAESQENFIWMGVRSHRNRADEFVRCHPGQAACVTLDVTQPGSWEAALGQILGHCDRLDVLVNNAGFHEDSLLGMLTIESWNRVIDANLNGVFLGCRSVLPTMIGRRQGRIINVSSLSALLPPPGQTSYAAAKAAVLALTQSLAKEVARLGITVNAVCPGYIETDASAGLSDEQRASALARIPMRRFGTPAEVAAAIRFLACSEAAYISGSALKIDGGIL